MSTAKATNEDYKFFDFLAPYAWPDYNKEQLALLREQVDYGIIHIETLVENALAQASNGLYERVAEYGRDFCDNSDAKKAVSQFRNNHKAKNHWTNSATIRDIKNKTGVLRAIIYSKENESFHFFAIPHKAYSDLTQVEIAMDRFSGYKGVPEGIPNGKWTRYEVDSFEKLATITESEANEL